MWLQYEQKSFFCDSVTENSYVFVAICGKKQQKKPLKAIQHIQKCSCVCFYEKKLSVFPGGLDLIEFCLDTLGLMADTCICVGEQVCHIDAA